MPVEPPCDTAVLVRLPAPLKAHVQAYADLHRVAFAVAARHLWRVALVIEGVPPPAAGPLPGEVPLPGLTDPTPDSTPGQR